MKRLPRLPRVRWLIGLVVFGLLLLLGTSPLRAAPRAVPPMCQLDTDAAEYARYECDYLPNSPLNADGSRAWALDIYVPKNAPAGPRPVFLFVHGGGWIWGEKREVEAAYPKILANLGQQAIIISINYRLLALTQAQKDAWSACVVRLPYSVTPLVTTRADMIFMPDTARAFSWVRANIDAFGGNPQHIVVAGHSAGGHIVTLLVADPTWLADALIESGQLSPDRRAQFRANEVIRGIINLSGPTNLHLDQDPNASWPLEPLNNYGTVVTCLNRVLLPQNMQLEVSPIYQYTRQSPKAIPPMLFVVGGGKRDPTNLVLQLFNKGDWSDTNGFVQGHRDFAQYAKQQGAQATVIQPLLAAQHDWGIFGGNKWCAAFPTHGQTFQILAENARISELGQVYWEEKKDSCFWLPNWKRYVANLPYRSAALQFILDPDADVPWDGVAFSARSLPSGTVSPYRYNLMGSGINSAGQIWQGVEPEWANHDTTGGALVRHNEPELNNLAGRLMLPSVTIDASAVADADGNLLPPTMFQTQAASSTEFEWRAPVPNGAYRLRLYFAEWDSARRIDISAEGAPLATNVNPWNGAAWKAKVVPLDELLQVNDGIANIVFRRSGASGPGPAVAAVELVPLRVGKRITSRMI